jgi:ABC-type transporter Mla maintaining outer membrane lipid asymmetry ATPase subunit MlaF
MSNVSLKKLDITLGGNAVIRGLDLEVEEGEFLVLLGPSGCGKSTLLHGIAGLIETSGGAIEIGGRDMSRTDPSERGIGMVFQSYALYPTMTVEKNMSFGLRIAGVAKTEIKRRVERANCSGANLPPCRAGSVSGWRSDERWCARLACTCSMNRSPTSTPSCAPTCAASSSCCTDNWARP